MESRTTSGGRVFATELALLTLTMAVSNFATGELLDRFGLSPRVVAIGIGGFFLLPGVAWFVTRRWWDKDKDEPIEKTVYFDRSEETETAQIPGL